MKNLINWKLFFILVIVCARTSIMVLPYASALTSSELELTPLILLLTGAQYLVLFAIVVFLGLLLSKRVGMGLPILQGVLEGKNQAKELKSILPISVILGAASGVVIVLLSIPFNRLIPEFMNAERIPAWKAFLASFYGGIAEEVFLRLFVVSLLVWLGFLFKKTPTGRPTNPGIWIAIVLAAIVFGLGHLPATAQITTLNGIVIARAILLNGVGGVVFGWLYWKKGLESAMIAHFSADIVLHIIAPAIAVLFV
jgi:membrane protease YdiL (CAAX protease family)